MLKHYTQPHVAEPAKVLEKHSHRTWVEIDSQALRNNIQALKGLVSAGTKFLAVVKANAYGHGLRETVHAIRDAVDWFGVDSLDEALALRQMHVTSPILILGYTLKERLDEVVAADLSQVVYDADAVRILGAQAIEQGNEARMHLKIETGTTRQGVWPEDLSKIFEAMRRTPKVRLEGVATHLANIEDTEDPSYMREQVRRFKEALALIEQAGFGGFIRHVAASAATILYPETHFDCARVGIALYGLWPSMGVRSKAAELGRAPILVPALSWKTRIAQRKRVPINTPVSYGLTQRVQRDSTVAVLPVGYADGFDRRLSGKGEVLIRGKKAKVLGRVCMNMVMVDVTDIPAAMPEDEVVLIGNQGAEHILADDMASKIATIHYEIISRISPMVPRVITE